MTLYFEVRKLTKTNALRLVEQAGIPCREASYDYDENDLNGMHAAEGLGLPPEQVFKTLVLRSDSGKYYVFCIPVCCELDLKKAAKAAKEKKVDLVPVKDLLGLTGYIRGGCSPVGMKKKFPTFLDETAELWDKIAVSAGARGLQMILPPLALMELIGGVSADLTT